MTAGASNVDAQRALLARLTGQEVEVAAFGPSTAGLGLAQLTDWPADGLRTWITVGMAARARSMWRGLPLGHELALTLQTGLPDTALVLDSLRAVALEDRRPDPGRRRPVEAHGAWAPGYPPHLVFVEPFPALGLPARARLGERYASFFSAVPIDDPELRERDRSPRAFVESLTPERAVVYPRTR